MSDNEIERLRAEIERLTKDLENARWAKNQWREWADSAKARAETAEASLAKLREAAKEVIEKSTNPFGREDSASVFVDRNAFNALRGLLEGLTKGPTS